MSQVRVLVLATAMLAASSGAFAGESYCIKCAGPDVTYKCEILAPPVGQPAQSLKLFCIYRLAKEGGHASCAVRTAAGAQCDGIKTELVYDGPMQNYDDQTVAAGLDDGEYADQGAVDQAAMEQAGDEAPPKTLVEATSRAVESSGRQLSNAGKSVKNATNKVGDTVASAAKKTGDAFVSTGEAIGNAAKDTYRCIASLFSNC